MFLMKMIAFFEWCLVTCSKVSYQLVLVGECLEGSVKTAQRNPQALEENAVAESC